MQRLAVAQLAVAQLYVCAAVAAPPTPSPATHPPTANRVVARGEDEAFTNYVALRTEKLTNQYIDGYPNYTFTQTRYNKVSNTRMHAVLELDTDMYTAAAATFRAAAIVFFSMFYSVELEAIQNLQVTPKVKRSADQGPDLTFHPTLSPRPVIIAYDIVDLEIPPVATPEEPSDDIIFGLNLTQLGLALICISIFFICVVGIVVACWQGVVKCTGKCKCRMIKCRCTSWCPPEWKLENPDEQIQREQEEARDEKSRDAQVFRNARPRIGEHVGVTDVERRKDMPAITGDNRIMRLGKLGAIKRGGYVVGYEVDAVLVDFGGDVGTTGYVGTKEIKYVTEHNPPRANEKAYTKREFMDGGYAEDWDNIHKRKYVPRDKPHYPAVNSPIEVLSSDHHKERFTDGFVGTKHDFEMRGKGKFWVRPLDLSEGGDDGGSPHADDRNVGEKRQDVTGQWLTKEGFQEIYHGEVGVGCFSVPRYERRWDEAVQIWQDEWRWAQAVQTNLQSRPLPREGETVRVKGLMLHSYLNDEMAEVVRSEHGREEDKEKEDKEVGRQHPEDSIRVRFVKHPHLELILKRANYDLTS